MANNGHLCARIMSVCFCAYCKLYLYNCTLYTPLHLHFIQIMHEFAVGTLVMGIMLLPLYVYITTPQPCSNGWNFCYHHESILLSWSGVLFMFGVDMLIQACLSWAWCMSLIECIVCLWTNWKLLCMVANRPTALVNLQEHYFIT